MSRVRCLRDNSSPKTSLRHELDLHDKTSLKRLFAVSQIYVTIFPFKRLFPM